MSSGQTPVPPWSLAIGAMRSIQVGSALSIGLISSVGAGGTAWLRLSMGAVIFLILARPPLHLIQRKDLAPLFALGVMTGIMTIAFLAAIDRIPLGTAVAIEFLGPLTVAAIRSHSRRMLIFPAVAFTGVILLTQPWQGDVNVAGIAFAALSAFSLATYILLTQKIGDRFSGLGSLSITITIAAITAAIVGIPQAAGHLSITVLATAAGLAILLPILPFAFELLALRRMTPTAFGTLMAIEPAIGVMIGLIILHQQPAPIQYLGIILVVAAGAAAQYGGRRAPLSERQPEIAYATSSSAER